MADFQTQVSDLTGFASTDDVALASWLADGCKEIINVIDILNNNFLPNYENDFHMKAVFLGYSIRKILLDTCSIPCFRRVWPKCSWGLHAPLAG